MVVGFLLVIVFVLVVFNGEVLKVFGGLVFIVLVGFIWFVIFIVIFVSGYVLLWFV